MKQKAGNPTKGKTFNKATKTTYAKEIDKNLKNEKEMNCYILRN